jgi:hypothetical protein
VLLSELARRLGAIGGGPNFGAGSGDQAGQAGGRGRSGGGDGGQARRKAAPAAAPSRPAAAAAAQPEYVGPSAARPAPAARAPDLTAADSRVPGWTSLIEVLMKQAPRVGSCLMTGLPELADDGLLTVRFSEDRRFAVKNITPECATIARVAGELWERQVRVELVLGAEGQKEEVAEEIRQEVAPTHREELAKACADDPALGDLVDMMGGGKPLPETERERWQQSDD